MMYLYNTYTDTGKTRLKAKTVAYQTSELFLNFLIFINHFRFKDKII